MAVHRRRRRPGLALFDLEPTNVLGRRSVRGASQENGKAGHDAQVIVLGLRRKTPDAHIFDHPLTKTGASRHGKRLVHETAPPMGRSQDARRSPEPLNNRYLSPLTPPSAPSTPSREAGSFSSHDLLFRFPPELEVGLPALQSRKPTG